MAAMTPRRGRSLGSGVTDAKPPSIQRRLGRRAQLAPAGNERSSPPMTMSKRTLCKACFVALAATVASNASPTIDEIFDLGRVGAPSISSDGSQIAYTLKGKIHLVQADGSGDRVLADGDGPRWSPAGDKLAFFASGDGSRQVWTVDPTGGESVQLTSHRGFIDRFRWAPDGGRIAFLARPSDQVSLSYFVRSRIPGKPTVVDRNNLPRNRLWIVDTESKSSRAITAQEFSVGGYEQWFPDSFSWAPDGSRIAFSKRPHAKAGSHLDGDIAVVDLNGGGVRVLAERAGMDGFPQWSPDGRHIAFITTERHDWVTVSHIYRIELDSGRTEKLTPDFDEKIKDFSWADAGRRILFIAGRGVSTQLFSLDVATHQVKALTDGNLVRGALSVSANGSALAFVEQGPAAALELYATTLHPFRPTRLTRANPQAEDWPRIETEVIRWESFDGMEIEGIVHKPVGFEEGRRYPLLVLPHGGPHGVMTNGFVAGEDRVFAQRGWLLFRPNFRGSGNYGEKFLRANLASWGIGDYQDVMTGVDWLIEKGWVDPKRMAMSGASYGGYMTSWTISQTNRFRAAVIGAPITDVPSFIRTTDVPERFEDYLGRDPSAYARSSPMHFAGNLSTPALIWHGAEDIRVPLMQGRYLYTALLKNGVPAEFLIYHGEAHGLRDSRHVRDLLDRKIEWLERWTLNHGQPE